MYYAKHRIGVLVTPLTVTALSGAPADTMCRLRHNYKLWRLYLLFSSVARRASVLSSLFGVEGAVFDGGTRRSGERSGRLSHFSTRRGALLRRPTSRGCPGRSRAGDGGKRQASSRSGLCPVPVSVGGVSCAVAELVPFVSWGGGLRSCRSLPLRHNHPL
jgi:hypothetical protein